MAQSSLALSKRCPRCKETKSAAEFSKGTGNRDGLQWRCRACCAAYVQANKAQYQASWRARYEAKTDHYKQLAVEQRKRLGKEKVAELNKAYREKHAAALSEASKTWRSINAEYCRVKHQQYYQENKEAFLEKRRLYWANNPAKVLELCRRRTAKQLMAEPAWADRAAMIALYELAIQRTQETGVPHHVDHIVPLQSKRVCGLHVPANMQVVSASENCSKGNRWWPDMP